jgi:hypothetical protein
MRSRLPSVTALVTAVTFAPAFAAVAREMVEYGKYICVIDRAAGIQSTNNSAQRFAGRIEIARPEEQKFFIEIIEVRLAKNNEGARSFNLGLGVAPDSQACWS